MRSWIAGGVAALLGAAAAHAATSSATMTLNFENVAAGNVSLAYTTDLHGPIPLWGFDRVSQVPVYAVRVGNSQVLGVRSSDTCTRVHVGLGTACADGAALLHSFRLVGTTSPATVILFDRGGNFGPGANGLSVSATGANGARTISFAAGSTGLAEDAVAEAVVVFGPGGGFVDDFVFDSIPCDHDEPPPPPPPPTASGDDWFTGGGWIYGTPTGAKATFGVGGGFKNGALWGHLNWIDHGLGMHAHWTEITEYHVVNDVRRHMEGTCVIDGQPGTFVLEIEDNGEPGRADWISLSLSNGYRAAGLLDGGGNLQLHKSSTKTTTTKPGGKTRKRRVR